MRIRFYNARILTMENDSLINGELWTQDSKIEYIGDANASDKQIGRAHV